MDELRQVFLNLGVKEDEVDPAIERLGISQVSDLAYFDKEEAFEKAGITSMLAQRKLVEEATRIKSEQIEAAKAITEVELNLSMLAADIDEEKWMEDLRQQGIIKFEQPTYIAGIKAVLAANMGVFNSVEKLAQMVDEYSVKNAIPSPSLYYTLQDIITRRQYGLVFAASENNRVNGVPIYATTDDMNQLMKKIMSDFVPSILEAARLVVSWHDDLAAQKTTDFFMEKTMQGQQTAQSTSYPSPAALYDAAVNMRMSINRTFSGNGIQKALAIYNEYTEFVKVLNDGDLPKSVGALDKDNVLNMLGFDANAAAVRSERYIVKFVISIMDAENLAKDNEVLFFRELHDLVRQIDWSALTGNAKDAHLFAMRPTGMPMIGPAGAPAYQSQVVPQIETHNKPGVTQMNGQNLIEVGAPLDASENN